MCSLRSTAAASYQAGGPKKLKVTARRVRIQRQYQVAKPSHGFPSRIGRRWQPCPLVLNGLYGTVRYGAIRKRSLQSQGDGIELKLHQELARTRSTGLRLQKLWTRWRAPYLAGRCLYWSVPRPCIGMPLVSRFCRRLPIIRTCYPSHLSHRLVFWGKSTRAHQLMLPHPLRNTNSWHWLVFYGRVLCSARGTLACATSVEARPVASCRNAVR